jgi:peptidoglycan LD-endopeptidase CwlK
METLQSKINKPPYESRDKAHLTSVMLSLWVYVEAKYKELYPEDKPPFLSYTYRSHEAQNDLYAFGRTRKGSIITRAKGGESPHNFFPSFAFDIAFLDKNSPKKLDWSEKGFKRVADIIAKSEYSDKVTWGGDFASIKDMPHFEQKGWKAIS